MRNKRYRKKQKHVSDAVKEYVKRTIASVPEKKFHVLNQISSVIGSGPGLVWPLSQINIGTGDSDRIGDRVTPISVQFEATLYQSQTPLLNNCFVRVLLFQWHMDDATDAPLLTDFCQGVTSTTLNNVNSLYTNDTRIKYTMLMDRSITVHTSNPIHKISFTSRKKLRKINYIDGGNNAVNNLYCIMFTDNLALLALPTMSHYTRVRYLDA